MRTRITIAFLVTLAVTLLLASGATLLLVRHASSVDAQRTVLRQAKAIQAHPSIAATPGVLSLIHEIAGIDSEAVVIIDANGTLASKPPPNIPENVIPTGDLLKGRVVSGVHDRIAWAAVPLFGTTAGKKIPARTVALVFESKENFSSDNILYFLITGLVSLLVAAAVSIEISRRISRHVRAAADAAGKIATGDFSARIDVPTHGYPELRELQNALNRMAHDLEFSRAAERGFLLSISHELRTPLTSIRGFAEAIEEGAPQDATRAASVIVAESDRLTRLIEDLLSLARLSAHQFSFRIARCDLTDTAREAVAALGFAFEEQNVALGITTPSNHLFGATDADRIAQVVSNLVENALNYARARVDVVIDVDAAHRLTVDVGDDGPGIAPELQPRVFERLFTIDRGHARRAGTGLGLAIVAELTQALGGEVSITSPRADGRGTVFHLLLPADFPSDN